MKRWFSIGLSIVIRPVFEYILDHDKKQKNSAMHDAPKKGAQRPLFYRPGLLLSQQNPTVLNKKRCKYQAQDG